MSRKRWKWLFLSGAIAIVILYMFEMTTTGIERVYGPMQLDQAPYVQLTADEAVENMTRTQAAAEDSGNELERQIAQLEQEIMELKKMALEKEKEALQSKIVVNPSINEPSVDRLADSTAGVLQQVSGSGIQFIAGLFHDIIN